MYDEPRSLWLQGFVMSYQLRRTLIIVGVFAACAAQAQIALPEHIYYKFNEGNGTTTANLASPGSGAASGTLSGGLTLGGSGSEGGALLGSSTLGHVSTGWDTNLGSSSWSIAFWLSPLVTATTQLNYLFGDFSAGTLRCFTGGVAGAQGVILRGPVSDNLISGLSLTEKNHIAYVYDSTAGEVKGYLNGVLSTTTNQSAINLLGSELLVGNYRTTTQSVGVDRWMDEFMVFGRALDASGVNDAMNLNVVPEPATMTLLALGALAARRRRKNS